jgi:5-(carboxyamino)imidazole ribonucleotide synthase
MIGVLGGGQLGRMLALAGHRLGERFCFLDPSPDPPAARLGRHIRRPYDDPLGLDELAADADVVTFEFENVPADAARRIETKVPVYPPPVALEAAQRRNDEKGWFEKLGIPTAPFGIATEEAELRSQIEKMGFPAVVKTASGGYDGKGQAVISEAPATVSLWERMGVQELIVEEFVPFQRELSIIGVRNTRGATAFYPLIENHHANGILRTSQAPAPGLTAGLQEEAEHIALALLQAFDYVGVLTVELFQTDDGLLANEMAPRVHNSGHYSIDAAACSQFENHLRAVCGLPLGSTEATGPATMFNLISNVPDTNALLEIPGVRLHLYDKSPRPGRKLGHVTVVGADAEILERVRVLTEG